MASQPIGRIRSEGRSSRPITKLPITVPAGMAAMSSPMVVAPPPKACAYGAARASGTTVKPASQPKSTRVRRTGLPNTAATPSQVISQGEGWLALRGRAGRGRTPRARMPADRLKDSESRATARYGPSAATSPPPARKPPIWPSWAVWLPITEPSGYLSAGRTSGRSADLAAENGVPSSTVPENSRHNPVKGSPGRAIRATSPARIRSRVIIICCRGIRSARPDRIGPPITGGR